MVSLTHVFLTTLAKSHPSMFSGSEALAGAMYTGDYEAYAEALLVSPSNSRRKQGRFFPTSTTTQWRDRGAFGD